MLRVLCLGPRVPSVGSPLRVTVGELFEGSSGCLFLRAEQEELEPEGWENRRQKGEREKGEGTSSA